MNLKHQPFTNIQITHTEHLCQFPINTTSSISIISKWNFQFKIMFDVLKVEEPHNILWTMPLPLLMDTMIQGLIKLEEDCQSNLLQDNTVTTFRKEFCGNSHEWWLVIFHSFKEWCKNSVETIIRINLIL